MNVKTFKNSISIFILAIFICGKTGYTQSGFVTSIYFKTGSYTIEKKYSASLHELAEGCRSDSFSYIRIFAFTDTTGSDNYNDELSKKRAFAVYNYLTEHGDLDTTKVYCTWLGKSSDTYDLHFPGAHAQKRCVDIWITFWKDKKRNKRQ